MASQFQRRLFKVAPDMEKRMFIFASVNEAVIAMLFAGGVGVFFGYYPARRASHLDPIEALRYE